MKLSVIVPAYQVEAYLPACLEALLDQDMGDYEIICVDDGSTDRTGEIARDYARRWPQVTVICQPNGGLSAARNAGLRAASGEYVYFMDADDVLARGVLGPLCRLAEEEGLDQLLFDYARFEDGAVPSLSAGVDPGRLRRYRDPLEMRRDPAVPAWRTAWNYLIRRAVLEGDVERGSVMMGQVAGMVHEIRPLRQIFEELYNGGKAVLEQVHQEWQ